MVNERSGGNDEWNSKLSLLFLTDQKTFFHAIYALFCYIPYDSERYPVNPCIKRFGFILKCLAL